MPEQSDHHQQGEEPAQQTKSKNETDIMEAYFMCEMKNDRPKFPHRAVVTAGMPYGNKTLHFGHIGGVFIPADIYARFLRDRIGKENVIFISGTDCYGSAIELGFEKVKEEGFEGTIEDYVRANNEKQKAILKAYDISLDLFEGSAIGQCGEIHKTVSQDIFNKLYEKGLLKSEKSKQFYDEEMGKFLNGRQVVGRCPINGCKSETAYAEECSLGHQFDPSELIAPKSIVSGKIPVLKEVENWFFNLPSYRNEIEDALRKWKEKPAYREVLANVIEDFLEEPSIYVKKEELETLSAINGFPEHEVIDKENKQSCTLVFCDLQERKKAVEHLISHGIRYRTGKTLVPLRISGNISWGIPIPEKDGRNGLTFWVWPESLWAPISFTKAYLEKAGCDGEWETWWKSEESEIYQFIGEDNIYFYGIAEIALFAGLDEGIKLPTIIPNHHLLYGKKKASSSGAIKPPGAMELLGYYTAEQLRIHFMNASLGDKSVSFDPVGLQGNHAGYDPVLSEGNLLTNVFNRLIRSAFYALQKINGGVFPITSSVNVETVNKCTSLILEYEKLMHECKLDKIFELLNIFLKDANKEWAANCRNEERICQLIMDTFHVIRVCMTLLHPIAPESCEMIKRYLQIHDDIWNWEYIFEPLEFFTGQNHQFLFLEPRVDFFKKHLAQIESRK